MASSTHLLQRAVALPDGTVRQVGALDPHWASPPLSLPEYLPVALNSVEGLAWSSASAPIRARLEDLLRAPFHVFWSYAIFDPSLSTFLDSFLRFAPRHFEVCAKKGGGGATF